MQRNGQLGWRQRVTVLSLWVISTAGGGLATAETGDDPGGMSRIFHVGCAQFHSGGSAAWNSEHDDATLADGYSYSVDGKSYLGHAPTWHCWFFDRRGSVTIRCPQGVQGSLHLHCVDLGNGGRKQSINVCGKYTDQLDDFPEPEGQWCEYEITSDDTRDGTIRIELCNLGGANAVVSRIEFLPAGVPDALAAEPAPDLSTPEGTVQWDWHRQERIKRRRLDSRAAVADVLERGDALAEDLAVATDDSVARRLRSQLQGFRRRHDNLVIAEESGGSVSVEWEELYFQARWSVRNAMLASPLLNFERLLFVKRHTPSMAHQCSHHLGTAQQPGADLCVLHGLRPDGDVRSILGEQLPPGGIGRPDLSFDATRVVFPYATPRPDPTPYQGGLPNADNGSCRPYQIYEMGVDGSRLVPLTDGPHENTEPCYLPDGRICFTSSRGGRLVQCGDWALVFSLFAMRRDGSHVRPLTEAKEGEWFPSVLDDGRIIYMRWEYVVKPFNTIQYLWTVNPDGRGARLAYGDHYAFSPGPLTFIEARQIPGTSQVITTGAAHHNCGAGPICIVDLHKNRGDKDGLLRVTPEVGYPETSEMAGTSCKNGWYNSPYPLSEKLFLVCYSFEPQHNSRDGYGIYLMDVHGNKELVYRDRERSCYSPIPLRARARPPVLGGGDTDPRWTAEPATKDTLAFERENSLPLGSGIPATEQRSNRLQRSHHGTLFVADVYRGLEGVQRGTVKYLRVLQSVPKSAHSVPQRLDIGIGSGWDPRIVLGTVPVEEDGSAWFRVPAYTPVFFQVLDEAFMDVRRMRSYMTVQPGETVGCVGCHESYTSAPPAAPLAALKRPARQIDPPPWGAIPMNFSDVVQPVLDQHCVQCHDGSSGEGKSFDLTGQHLVAATGADNHYPPAASDPYRVTASFVNLLPHVDFIRLSGYGGGNLPLVPFAVGSHRSQLIQVLDAGHYDVRLDADSRRALVAWIDCNAPFLGGWEDYAAE